MTELSAKLKTVPPVPADFGKGAIWGRPGVALPTDSETKEPKDAPPEPPQKPTKKDSVKTRG